ncbi:hypothetical protein AAG570_003807 [Ranatra chinensis]|uniref:Amine oxidase domain-containing protein n=1 Tax=Ranatra chinensis TaxID=642074 RepID=A0ABD0Y4R3_9HEMI
MVDDCTTMWTVPLRHTSRGCDTIAHSHPVKQQASRSTSSEAVRSTYRRCEIGSVVEFLKLRRVSAFEIRRNLGRLILGYLVWHTKSYLYGEVATVNRYDATTLAHYLVPSSHLSSGFRRHPVANNGSRGYSGIPNNKIRLIDLLTLSSPGIPSRQNFPEWERYQFEKFNLPITKCKFHARYRPANRNSVGTDMDPLRATARALGRTRRWSAVRWASEKKSGGGECPAPSRDSGQPGPCKSQVLKGEPPLQKKDPSKPRNTLCSPKEVCQLWHFDEQPTIFRSDTCPSAVQVKRIQMDSRDTNYDPNRTAEDGGYPKSVCCPDPPSEGRPGGVREKRSPKDKKVVILGAGLSGLSAAAHLANRGATDVTVLEASNRPGGRIKSMWLENSVVELGASWSPLFAWDNPLLDAALMDGHLECQLGAADPTHGLFQGPDGRPMPLLSSLVGYTAVHEILTDAEKTRCRLTGLEKGAVLEFIGTRVQQAIRRCPKSIAVPVSRAMMGTVNAVCAKYGHAKGLVENDQYGAYARLPGSLMHIPLGFMGAVGTIIKDIPPERILYKKEVTVVRWGTVTLDQSPRAVVRCADGTEYPADYVVVTCPLGVLKEKAEQMFCPYLSSKKLSAIRMTKYGHANKIFIRFDEPFHLWRKKPINFTWRKDETVGRGGWLEGLRWVRRVRGNEYLLCLTVFGPEAKLTETRSEGDLCREARVFLQELLGEPELPGMRVAARTRWSRDRLFLGAYTELEANEGLQWDLAEPVPFPTDLLPPVIYFGGEATFVGVNSTLHSALIRGVQVADLVIKVMMKYPVLDEGERQERKPEWEAVQSEGVRDSTALVVTA